MQRRLLTRRFIAKDVRGGESDVQYPRIHMRTLRQKLEVDPEQLTLTLTKQGVGYRLKAAE